MTKRSVVLISKTGTRWSATIHLLEGQSLPGVVVVEHRVFVHLLNSDLNVYHEAASKPAFGLKELTHVQ